MFGILYLIFCPISMKRDDNENDTCHADFNRENQC